MEQFKKSNVLKFHFITGTVLLIVLYNFCLAMLFEPGSDWEHNKSAFNPAKQADAIIFAFGWSLGSFGYFCSFGYPGPCVRLPILADQKNISQE